MLTLNLEDTLKSGLPDQNRKKKQKLVKHKRKNWKKTDIDEVEQGIDDLRQQKNHGGVLSEKKDEDLFFINKEKTPHSIDENKVLGKKKRPSLEEKLGNLKCYKNLQPDHLSYPAHVVNDNKKPDENSKRQHKLKEKITNKSKNRMLKITIRPETDKENTVVLKDTLKKKKKVKKLVTRSKDRKNIIIETDFEKDIWQADKHKRDEIEENFLKYTKEILTKKPDNPILPKSAVPKLEVPHPGASYNPDYDDHQNLLLRAHLIELEKLKKEQKEMRKQTNNIKKMSWDQIEKLWLDEMAVDSLFNQAEIEEEHGATEKDDSNKKMRSKKEKKNNETKIKRKRKQLLEKLMLKQKENEKHQRIQQNEIFRLKSIKKEINQDEKLKEEQRLKKETEQKQKELFAPKRLGSLKYEEPEIELKLSNEITGNLRTLKPEGNIMVDRYKSFQKRNIIEPRDKAKSQKKYWKKKFEKKNAYEKTYFVK